jgi:hypothetical protein
VVGTEKRSRGRTEKLPNKNKEQKEKKLTNEKPLDLESPIQGRNRPAAVGHIPPFSYQPLSQSGGIGREAAYFYCVIIDLRV